MSLSLRALQNAQLSIRQLEALSRPLEGSVGALAPLGQDRFEDERALLAGLDAFEPEVAQDPNLSFEQALSRLLKTIQAIGEASVEPQPAPAESKARALSAAEPPRVDRARLYGQVFVQPPAA
jgi:hypothetical protein